MAAYVELTIEQGANLISYVTVSDDYGSTINLQTYSVSSQLRKSYYSTSSVPITATITGISNGEITLTMTSANTANLTAGRYLYDLIIKNSVDNYITRVIEGTAVILPSVTR